MPEEERILQEAEGLAEAMVNERGQEVRLAVHLPVSSPSEVREAWERMVRVMEMERVFDPERRVIPVWRMKLEELLAEIDVERVERYLQETGLMRALRDRETRRTLEAFFRHDLNASEAARHLYIHRNTLLYRLERLKQESGLDVRRFEDAVRVKVALLLRRRLEAEL
jgi:sugar diacid utilization regulator